jgi:hypothetical protein
MIILAAVLGAISGTIAAGLLLYVSERIAWHLWAKKRQEAIDRNPNNRIKHHA